MNSRDPIVLLIAAIGMLAGGEAAASWSAADVLTPSKIFLQAGNGDDHARAYIAGVIWDWRWSRQYAFGTLTGYSEAGVGRWTTELEDGGRSSTWSTQVGLTPVLRFVPGTEDSRWFAEIGIGGNVIFPIYQSSDKSFSTRFNFGDHIAFGRFMDAERRNELTLRLQHFSNAGIDHPNPGENFIQLRYSRRLGGQSTHHDASTGLWSSNPSDANKS